MGIGLRIFLIDDNNAVQGLAIRRFERLTRYDSAETLPQCAGKRARCAIVILEIANRKPVSILDVSYTILPFDSQGRIDRGEMDREMRLAVDSISDFLPKPQSGNVVDATARFAQKRMNDEFSWKPEPEVKAAIVEAIFKRKKKD